MMGDAGLFSSSSALPPPNEGVVRARESGCGESEGSRAKAARVDSEHIDCSESSFGVLGGCHVSQRQRPPSQP